MKIFFCVIVTCFTVCANAVEISSPKLNFGAIESEHSNLGYVFDSVKDKSGNLWIASTMGLFKYDGNRLSRIEKLKNQLETPYIGAITITPNDELFLGTVLGMVKYDTKNDTIKIYDHTPKNKNTVLVDERASSLFLDKNDSLLIGLHTQLNQLNIADETFSPVNLHNLNPSETLYRAIFKDKDNVFWLGTFTKGLIRYNSIDSSTATYQTFTENNKAINITRIKKIIEHPSNPENLLIATAQGLFKFNKKTASYARYPDANPILDSVNALTVDANNNIWVGGNNLYQINTHGQYTTYSSEQDFNLDTNEAVSYVYIDEQNTVFVAYFNSGLFKASPFTSKVRSIRSPGKSLTINALLRDSENTVWIATNDALLKGFVKDSEFHYKEILIDDVNSFENIGSISEGKDAIWVSTERTITRINNDKILSYKIKDSIATGSKIEKVLEQSDNQLLIKFKFEGIYVLNLHTGNMKNIEIFDQFDIKTAAYSFYELSPNRKKLFYAIKEHHGILDLESKTAISIENQLPAVTANEANSIHYGVWNVILGKGNLYITYNADFYSKFDWSCECLSVVDTGTSIDIINIQPDEAGVIWLVNNEGYLYSWIPGTDKYNKHTTSDGLPKSRASIYVGTTLNGSGALVASKKGVIWLDQEFLTKNPHKPTTHITTLLASGFNDDNHQKQALTVKADQELHFKQNNLKFSFSSTSTASTPKTHFKYRLVGFNESWSQTDSNYPTASYTNLDSGNYVFEVISSNNDGFFGEPAKLNFTITPAWYKTRFAYGLYIFFFVCTLFLTFKISRIYSKRKEKVLQEFVTKQTIELISTNSQLKEAQERAKRYYSFTAHGLRNPLTILDGILSRFPKSAETGQLLDNASYTLNELFRKTDLLLMASKLDSNDSKKTMKVNFSELVEQITERFSAKFNQSGLSLVRNIQSNIGVEGDIDALSEIPLNLLSNAVKYSKVNGEVVVSLTLKDKTLVLTIEDEGIGIPKETIPLLTKAWSKHLHENVNSNTFSSGLGMAIVNDAIKKHGGRLTVDSEVNIGTKFTVELPAEQADSSYGHGKISRYYIDRELTHATSAGEILALSQEVYVNQGEYDKSKPLILIVEDEPRLAKQHKDALSSTGGYEIIVASNGESGLNFAKQHLPNIIVSDVMMPGMTGVELTKAIKEDVTIGHTPIILMTANNDESVKYEALGFKADDFLLKPVSDKELYLRINNSLERAKKFKASLAPNGEALPAATDEEKKTLEVKRLAEEWIEQTFPETPLAKSLEASLSKLAFDGVPPAKVNTLFFRLIGVSAHKFIINYKLEKAKSLLKDTDDDLADIAVQCGFGTQQNLTSNFSKHVRCSPKIYRMKQLKEVL